MGWTASGDVGMQVRVRLPGPAAARAWAAERGLAGPGGGGAPGGAGAAGSPQAAGHGGAGRRPPSYADNFARGRRLPWTH